MKYLLLPCWLLFIVNSLFSQSKKMLDHADVHRWQKIEQQKIANDGQWVVWAQVPTGEGDPALHLWNANSGTTVVFQRGTEAHFSEDSKWLAFKIKPALDSLKSLRRKKVKDEDLPKDSLGIYDLTNGKLEKIPRLKNFSMPEKWSGWLAFQIETEKTEKKPAPAKDTVAVKSDTVKTLAPKPKPSEAAGTKKPKKEDKDNGYRLIVQHLNSGQRDTFAYVKEFALAKRAPRLLFYSTGKGDTLTFSAHPKATTNGLYWVDLEKDSFRTCLQIKGKYQQLALDEWGTQAAFIADLDTTKARIRPWQLCYWSLQEASARQFTSAQVNAVQQGDWIFSEHARPVFSKNADKLYFGMALPPILNDTTLLKEEIVEVEVWAWNDKRLYTQEKVRLENEKKRSYPFVFHIPQKRFVPLGSPELPEIRLQEDRNASLALGITEEPYTVYLTSEGTAHKDLYAVNIETGAKTSIVKDLRCSPSLSPEGKFITWWSDPDTAWFVWNARTAAIVRLTNNQEVPFFDEESDVPDYPGEYGMAGWLEGDAFMLVYDKYDIWKLDPDGKEKPLRLTNGRASGNTYRYLKLDPEQRSIPFNAPLLLHQFNHADKSEGYAWLDLASPGAVTWLHDNFAYSKSPIKAKNTETLLFTKENYETFPDLQLVHYYSKNKQVVSAHHRTKQPVQVSNANPQKSDFQWGSIEMVTWTSLTGEKINGLLVKPEGFDSQKQYPMIVNFYERLSDDLNRHRAPDFHRSQINYTFYASRGYLVFAPDIPYRIGYPGESAYDAIMSGVTALIAKGFVDPRRVALQGHSWGGYQSAYVVTRTNLFACAEAGAPVANMTSAYGGIRWESGLSRAFQYEHQQSRIGGSLWEKPKQFIENSPLFALDKVETPLLIMANDKDGAVPWYQGIELFSGLRRLGKPAWLLNYNDEPHWPVKLQNRVDFQKRMQQFFDHYLMDAAEPSWMKRGVPPMEKGILQGY